MQQASSMRRISSGSGSSATASSSSSRCGAPCLLRCKHPRSHTAAQQQQRQTHISSRLRLRAIEEKRETAGTESEASPDMMSSEQLQKLAELRRQRNSAPQPSSNIVQGAFEEAQLISWPTPGKALLDTVLVLAIVAATGSLLFGLNVLLADASQWWYSL